MVLDDSRHMCAVFERIAISTDGSESNRVAVEQGLSLARDIGVGKVVAISVFDPGNYGSVSQGLSPGLAEDMIESTEAALKRVVARGKEFGIEVEPKIITGRPADALIEESKNFDLIVTGTLGKTGVQRALLGSVAEKVVRMAHCPVFVCRCPKSGVPDEE